VPVGVFYAACILCDEVVREDGKWTECVVLWRGVKAPICVPCASKVADLYSGADIGLYLGPGREIV
jgi:hypothetical protein